MTMIENILTEDEMKLIRSFYPLATPDPITNKLILTPIRFISDRHAVLLCYWSDNIPFNGTKKEDWLIKREPDKIIVRHKKKLHSFNIDLDSGNVVIYNECRLSNLGTNVYVMQFYMLNNYLFPLFFGPGHWANGRNANELDVAVIDKSPLNELLLLLFNKDSYLVDEWYFDRKLQNINLNNLEVFINEYLLLKNQLGIAV